MSQTRNTTTIGSPPLGETARKSRTPSTRVSARYAHSRSSLTFPASFDASARKCADLMHSISRTRFHSAGTKNDFVSPSARILAEGQ